MVEATDEHRKIGLGRAFVWGFVIGAVVLVLAAFISLLFDVPEWLQDLLTPGALLLSPLADAMADWPGLVNVGLAAVANGAIYGVIAVAVAAIANALRN
jgi:hypothetical protein